MTTLPSRRGVFSERTTRSTSAKSDACAATHPCSPSARQQATRVLRQHVSLRPVFSVSTSAGDPCAQPACQQATRVLRQHVSISARHQRIRESPPSPPARRATRALPHTRVLCQHVSRRTVFSVSTSAGDPCSPSASQHISTHKRVTTQSTGAKRDACAAQE